MKRVLASFLILMVLLLSLSVPAGADHAAPFPTKVIPLWNADENWDSPGDFTVDRETQVEGEGCVSIELGKNATFIAQVKLPEVDATGMRYLEFDVYVSDLAILEAWLALEGDSIGISSSGQPDHAEKRIHLSKIAMQLFAEGCPRIGWNHIAVPLDQMSDIEGADGKLDLSQVNFLRIFILSWSLASVPEAKDWVLKFDNFVLTNREIAFDSHTPGEWQYDENKHWRYCTECGKKIDEYIHSPNCCIKVGVCETKYICYDCGKECGPFEHEFTVKDTGNRMCYAERATCTRGALYYYSCARCGEPGTETFESGKPREHTSEMDCISCDAESHAYHCKNCHEQVGEAVSHDFSEWEMVREATEEKSGLKRRSCAGCTYVDEQEIAYVAPELPNAPESPDEPEPPQTPAQPVEPSDEGCSAVLVSGANGCLVALMVAVIALKKRK